MQALFLKFREVKQNVYFIITSKIIYFIEDLQSVEVHVLSTYTVNAM